jgi:HEAT repeat protein
MIVGTVVFSQIARAETNEVDSEIRRCVRILNDQKSTEREAIVAILRLEMIGSSSVPKLITIASDKNHKHRGLAIYTLGSLEARANAALAVIMEAVSDVDPDIQVQALRAVEKIGFSGPNVRRVVLERLESPVLGVRIAAAGVMLNYEARNTAAVKVLQEILEKEEAEGKPAALATLRRHLKAASVLLPQIRRNVKDESLTTSLDSIKLLGEIGRESMDAVDVLVEKIKGRDTFEIYYSIRALEKIGAPASSAIPALKALLDADEPAQLLFQARFSIRVSAAVAIERLDGPNATANRVLTEALKQPGPGQLHAAAYLITKTETEQRTIDALLKVLESKDADARLSAALILAGANRSEAVPELARSIATMDLDDVFDFPSAKSRWAALTALGSLGARAKQALPALEKAASQPYDEVMRAKAAEAIEKIRP